MSAANQTDRIAYGQHDRIRIGAVAYICGRTTDEGHELERVDKPGMVEFFSHDEMKSIERSGKYRWDKSWFTSGKVRARERSGVDDFDEIPKRELPKLIWKLEFIHRYRDMVNRGEVERTNEGITAAIEKIAIDVNRLECAQIVVLTNE